MVPFPSLFARRATGLGSSGGAPWLAAPWPCLSCSCACCRALAARPWQVFLVGFEGIVRHPASLNFRLFFRSLFAPRATALGSSGGRPGWVRPGRALRSCACCRALAARPWRVFFVGFEGTVRHPRSLIFRSFSVPFCTPCHCAWV